MLVPGSRCAPFLPPFCESELSMTAPNPDFINFGGLLSSEQDSQAHFAFTGTTGSGKTLLMRLLQQSTLCHVGKGIGYRAIVYDAKQDAMPLLSAYCDRSRLFTMNPFDDRGVAWDIAADVTEPRVALEMAFTLIPEASESQPYFANASRHLTYGIMLSFMLRGLDWTLADVLRALSSAKRCRKVLEQHPHTSGIVEHYFSDERLLNDIFSTIATKMLLYESIAGCWDAANERISLKTWSAEEMILVLGNTEISRFAIDNINRCIFKRASDLILSKSEGTTERSWFYIDEVSEAGRLPISSLLKKGRSKGGRVAIAYQSISGLRDPKLFGQHQTDDILGQIGNRFFGLIECPETAEYGARVIGDSEIQQMSRSETRSRQGSSTTRNTAPVVRRAVLPSEFMSIPPCDFSNGLSGLFTTRSGNPAWDWISPSELSDMLISPAADVDDFVPRNPNFQLVEPWSAHEEKEFAPGLLQTNRTKKSRSPDIDPPNYQTEKHRDVNDFSL